MLFTKQNIMLPKLSVIRPVTVQRPPITGQSLNTCNVLDFSFSSFVPAVEALKRIHAQNKFRNNLGPENWIAVTKKNGGGSSHHVLRDQRELAIVNWTDKQSSATWFAADAVLAALNQDWTTMHSAVRQSARFDLESVVKTIASMTVPGVRRVIHEQQQRQRAVTPQVVLNTWDRVWKSPEARFILPLRNHARVADYELLKTELRRLDL